MTGTLNGTLCCVPSDDTSEVGAYGVKSQKLSILENDQGRSTGEAPNDARSFGDVTGQDRHTVRCLEISRSQLVLIKRQEICHNGRQEADERS